MPKTVLLDVDGTLIDSNDAHARAWMDALEEAGFEPQYPAVRKKIGMGGDHLLPAMTGLAVAESEGREITKRQGEIFREKYLPQLKPFPGARDLIMRLRRDGYQMVIATSGKKGDVEQLLKQTGLDDLEIPMVTADDADASKPEPDIVEAAMKKAESRPHETYMIGDTPYDTAAADKAGVRAIGFTSGGWIKDDLKPAVAVYEGAQDLLNHFEESPLGGLLKEKKAS